MAEKQSDVVKACMTWFKNMGFTKQERIDYINVICNTDVTSSTQLTEPQWHTVMAGLRGFVYLRMMSRNRQPLHERLGEP